MKEGSRRHWAVLGTVVAVLAVGVGAAVLGRSSHHAPPAVLRLAVTAAPRADAATGLSDAVRTSTGDYELVGTLPEGRPPDTPAYPLTSRADAAVVARLATALHAGTPVRDGTGWRAGGLVVNADGSWWWSACADGTVSSDGAVTGCGLAVGTGGTVTSGPGVATGAPGSAGAGTAEPAPSAVPEPSSAPKPSVVPLPPSSPVPPDAGPTAEPVPVPVPTAAPYTVRTAAAPVLAAVGLDVSDARVDGPSAVVDPRVGGLPTYGMATRVGVAPDGTLTDASGWLATASRGDSYPLLTAKEAFDALPALPQALLLCPVTPDGKGCLEPQPIPVTGAHLGLGLRYLREGAPVLVPSWLFEVRGTTEPVAGLAVEPRYLDDGSTPSTGPSTGPSTRPTTGASTEPHSAPPVPPASDGQPVPTR